MTSQFDVDLIPEGALEYFEANPNVLVVEDDRFMGQVFLEMLTDVGFNVIRAANGVTALKKLKEDQIDFIILDILLPAMNGFEIYEKVQEDPETKGIPVMMVTAWADTLHLSKASQMGIKHFLAKPFTEDELLEEILTLLVDTAREKG
jgi:CheY-like chemotaxis protein